MIRCNKRIVIGPYAETYCQKELAHPGACSTLGHVEGTASRCTNKSPRGTQCGLPVAHYGQHWNQNTLESWKP